MATFTVTADQSWDTFAGKAGGDTYNVNGGTLRIDTDTRYCANSTPTTGTLAIVTISSSLGGTVLVDGTQVRLIPYNTGTGNVPSVGTVISQGGVSATVLCVMSAVNAVPTTAGSAMPASGFIKVKGKAGGDFAAGALTGIGASATGPDVVGWIEVAADEVSTNVITIPRLGKWQVTGAWYEAGTTNGTRGQTIQLPNGTAAAALRTPGVWIETAAGSGVYEFWPALTTANGFVTTAHGTDDRSKIVQDVTGGLIRIGSDGTNDIGALPPTGCKIRIPNVIFTGNTTAARNTAVAPNATLGTRMETATTSAGVVDIDKAYIHWYLNLSQPYSVRLSYACAFDGPQIISEVAAPLDLDNFHVVPANALDAQAVTITSCFAGGTVKDCVWGRAGTIAASDHPASVNNCIGQTFQRVVARAFTVRTNATVPRFQFSTCSNLVLDGVAVVGVALALTTCSNVQVLNQKYCNTTIAQTTTNPMYGLTIESGCNGISVSGFSLFGSTINMHPYSGLYTITASTNVKIRNIGTAAARFQMGTANASGVVVNHGGNNSNIEIKRVYVQNTRTGIYTTINSDTNVLYENVWGDAGDAPNAQCLNMLQRGMYAGGTPTAAFTSVYGSIFWDAFISATQGRIGLFFNEPTAAQASYVYDKTITGASGYTSTGSLALVVSNNTVTYEWPHFIKGYTALANVAPTLTGTNTGNFVLQYQIDTGSGWNGTWKTLNAANLSIESGITAATGFRLKIKVTCATPSATNALTGVYIVGTTDATSQQVQYPLDLNALALTGLKPGSEVRVYPAGQTTEIAGEEDINDGVFTAQIDAGSYPSVDISILALGFQNTRLLSIDMSAGSVTIPVQQVLDRQYENS